MNRSDAEPMREAEGSLPLLKLNSGDLRPRQVHVGLAEGQARVVEDERCRRR